MQTFIIGVISAVLLLVMVYLYIVSVIVDNMYDGCNMCNMCHRSLKHIDWIYESNKDGNTKICIECIKRMR